ncbi:lipid-A-disaccharide synthase [Prevotella melaninogenica]
MKYYLIVGEASGDLHASRLMQSLMQYDPEAEFRFFGGDLMAKVGGTRVKHYRELAYMGFVPVLLHLPTIFKNMKMCKEDIMRWKPDAVILVDYPGFNLSIAKFVKKNTNIPVYYYISPKIWAWKEWRIKAIKRDVKEMFSILPFEVPFYEKKHNYKIHYVGNPTAEEVDNFRHVYSESKDEFCQRNGLSSKPIIALLAGSRKQEIKDNLLSMLEAARHFEDYQMVVAAAPSIAESYYKKYLGDSEAKMVKTQTYELLSHATVALVTSGTATLETALLNVPQVVCYETPVPKLIRFAFKHIIKVRFISLVNLIADKEIVQELLADRFSIRNIANELYRILPGQPSRERMLADYQLVRDRLGSEVAPDNAARIMVEKLISSHANQYVNRQINESTNEQVCELVSEQYETLTHEHTDHNGEVLIGESKIDN